MQTSEQATYIYVSFREHFHLGYIVVEASIETTASKPYVADLVQASAHKHDANMDALVCRSLFWCTDTCGIFARTGMCSHSLVCIMDAKCATVGDLTVCHVYDVLRECWSFWSLKRGVREEAHTGTQTVSPFILPHARILGASMFTSSTSPLLSHFSGICSILC